MQDIQTAIAAACQELYGQKVQVELSRPAQEHGDYASNIALQLSKKVGKSPHDIAEAIVAKLGHLKTVVKAEIAGPGFINIWLSDEVLALSATKAADLPKPLAGQQVLAEYGDPNPFKEMHIGHAYSYIVGDAIASILEASGAKVERLSYHGDVGLHVAKAIWGMLQSSVDKKAGAADIGAYYAKGAQAYEKDAKSKAEINEINQQIYSKSDPAINELYQWGKKASFGYFDQTLKDLDVHSAVRFYESESASAGKTLVEQNLGKVFEYGDQMATYEDKKPLTNGRPIVYKRGSHTRVFITGNGLPTYEAKDLGLAKLKDAKYPKAGQSIVITAHEQSDYFKVMLAALAEIDKPLAAKTKHLYHGFVSLSSGKMSSRTGEVYGAIDLMNDVDQATKKTFGQQNSSTRNAAIKYGFLAHRLGSDIVYDVEQALSLEGNSGPYLQYAHARARSILQKAKGAPIKDLDDAERRLARRISQFPEVVAEATKDFMPSHVCTYLYELAQQFNRFYEHNRVVGDKREGPRASLVSAYADVLKSGLGLLNIEAPERV